ncbi:Lipopolysaccharide export system permease protein LptF [Burkholderiales bacterium]|nr:MAG: LPS export ABC transporter permease LptF [Burkholderiales bacterium]CAG0974188.1 Lipopolysaccharide export system permease protein LptF [Burkholderiales bacterium]
MIFQRALLRELAATAASLFVVLLGILFTQQLIRLLGAAARGTLATEGVIAILGFKALYYLPVLIALSGFLAVLLALSRAHRDSEMIVWFTAGQSLTAWLRPVTWFGLPVVLVVALLSLALSPWATQKSEEYQRLLESREELSALSPGLFKEIKRDDRLMVFYVESFNPLDNSINNFFAQAVEKDQLVTMVARGGYLETRPNGDRFVILNNGRRYEGTPGTAGYRYVDFEVHGLRIDASEVRPEPPSLKAVDSVTLINRGGRAEIAELFWRLSLPLAAIILIFLAIPLAHVDPRVGRSFNLIVAGLIWATYSSCTSIAQSLIAQGNIGLWTGMLLVHGSTMLVVLALFYRRLSVFRLLAGLRGWR